MPELSCAQCTFTLSRAIRKRTQTSFDGKAVLLRRVPELGEFRNQAFVLEETLLSVPSKQMKANLLDEFDGFQPGENDQINAFKVQTQFSSSYPTGLTIRLSLRS